MSTEQEPASYDPRYAGIYQRGAVASTPSSAPDPPSFAQFEYRPSHDGAGSSAPSTISEVGAPPEVPGVPVRARNPFDVWVWVVAAVLTALGVYFLTAPIVSAESYAEAMMSQTGNSMYFNPWYNYTINVAPTLILLGIGTAVVQLFVLSIRHTLRAR